MDRLRPAMLIAALVVDVGRRLPRRGGSAMPLDLAVYNAAKSYDVLRRSNYERLGWGLGWADTVYTRVEQNSRPCYIYRRRSLLPRSNSPLPMAGESQCKSPIFTGTFEGRFVTL